MSPERRITPQAAPLRSQVVDALRADILAADMRPGERLLEATLCDRYGVSRTVVREALRQLEAERLVTMLANRGPIVTILEEDEIVALYEVRASLEGLMGELFAERAPGSVAERLVDHVARMPATYLDGTPASRQRAKETFYEIMLDGARNPVLHEHVQGVHRRIGVFRNIVYRDSDRAATSMLELGRIVDAAARVRDPGRARRYCEEHVRSAAAVARREYCAWLARFESA